MCRPSIAYNPTHTKYTGWTYIHVLYSICFRFPTDLAIVVLDPMPGFLYSYCVASSAHLAYLACYTFCIPSVEFLLQPTLCVCITGVSSCCVLNTLTCHSLLHTWPSIQFYHYPLVLLRSLTQLRTDWLLDLGSAV